MDGAAPHPAPGSRPADLEVALAEYNALRAEILGSQQTQTAVLTVALAFVGVLFSVALQDGGDRRLLLAVPAVTLVAALLHISRTILMFRIGSYIRDHLWRHVQAQSGYPLSWEAHVARRHHEWTPSFIASGIVLEGSVPMLLAGAGGIALVVHEGHPAPERWGWAAVAVVLVAYTAMAFAVKAGRRAGTVPEPATAEPGPGPT